MPHWPSDIEPLIEQLTAQLTALVRQSTLDEVLASLQDGMNGASPRPGPGRPAGSGKKLGRPRSAAGFMSTTLAGPRSSTGNGCGAMRAVFETMCSAHAPSRGPGRMLDST